jgi:HD-GYP domain-containing protein (c-di-GMP phosphodiesterase class II)
MTRYAMRGQPEAVLLQTLRESEPDLDRHLTDVADLAHRIGQALDLGHEELARLRHAALLHDVGKVAIPDQILEKTGPLDAHERATIERHTLIGERILNASPALTPLAPIVRATHEAWDGSGYPDRIAGETIPLAARIIAVCDAFDAITHDRPYRPKSSVAHAHAELAREAGHQFDPTIVEILLDLTG